MHIAGIASFIVDKATTLADLRKRASNAQATDSPAPAWLAPGVFADELVQTLAADWLPVVLCTAFLAASTERRDRRAEGMRPAKSS